MDSKLIQTILTKGLEKTKKSIQKNLASSGRNASGETSKSLKVVSSSTPTQVKASLIGSSVLEQLEYGRRKTIKRSPKGDSVWFDKLLKWVRMKTNKPDGFAFYLFKRINEKGYKGTPGIVSNPVDDFKKEVATNLKAIIIKDFKSNGINSNK